MALPLRVLILEDVPSDAKLLLYELRQAGFDPDWRLVQTEQEFIANLALSPDVILSDFSMPQFDAPTALSRLQECQCDIPFIIVTGTISEEVAVECMKRGAADYLLKDRLGRLGQAVTRVLEEKKIRGEKRRAEEALRESEERYRLLVSNIPDVTWLADREGRPFFCSPNTESIYGYTREEIDRSMDLGFWSGLIHPEDLDGVCQGYRALFDSGKPFDVEYRARRKDGKWIWIHARAMSTYENDGVRYAYGVNSDVTERKRLEAQLIQAQKMEAVGRLAGGVAHDFNNVLTAIIGYSQILLQGFEDGDPRWEHTAEILKAGKSAALLTRQLLAFSRQQVMEPQILDLNSVVSETEKMLRRLIGENIDLAISLSPGIGSVKADPGQISQVIMNLAVNSRDAMPRGGRLAIETSEVDIDEQSAQNSGASPGRYVRLSVTDTGCGIGPETLPHIFEPFFTTKEKGKGTGLGLSTVYGIVRQSAGHCEVYSEAGAWTAVHIYLPRVEQAVEAPQTEAEAASTANATETVLLVEDDVIVRTFVGEALKLIGYRVLAASNGEQALRLSREFGGTLHLLLTDTVMPEMSGLDLAVRITQSRPETRVLMMSGYTDETVVERDILTLGYSFIQKPFTPGELNRKLREALNSPPRSTDGSLVGAVIKH